MFNICQQCGLWSEEQAIVEGSYAICPHCGHRHWFRQLPLFVVTGPSGVGKSTLCIELAPRLSKYVCLESDNLWGAVQASADDNYRGYWNVWLNMAVAIGQSGRPVVLFGTTLPDKLEFCPKRSYFSNVYYLALVCDDKELAQRLRERPEWRGCDEVVIANMISFNHWLKKHANTTTPAMTLLDITGLSLGQAFGAIELWLTSKQT